MITFQKFPFGRFGNNLFQLAALNSFAKRYNTTWAIPRWEHSHLFENPLPELDQLPEANQTVIERKSAYDQEYFDQFEYQKQVVDLQGYFQNEKYFDPSETKKLLKFKPEIVEGVRKKYDYLFTRPTIAIGVRRGDYVNNPNYYQLPVRYYIQALQKFDFSKYNIVFFSDDLQWCYFHFRSVNHAFFPKFESDIESFICGTLMQNWIISNSTYHFWASYLSNAERVIQPAYLFAGDLLKKEGPNNFYIENEKFEIFDPGKIDLMDVTFTIPCKMDNEDRKRNLDTVVSMLLQDFDTNIVVGEQGGNKFQYFEETVKYINFNNLEHFHRTAMLNWMAREATTPIIVNLDADCLFAPMQLVTAVQMLRDGKADFVYPYKYQFIRVPKRHHTKLKNDLAVFMNVPVGDETEVRPSVGGAVLFNREKFLANGGENEKFVSFGPEDVERYERFIRLGLKNKRVRGPLYHLDHFVGVNSSQKNPFYQDGVYELIKQREMTNDELKEYVATWK